MTYIVEKTEIFEKWVTSIRDIRTKVAILRRVVRAENGNLGDHKSLGNGISEMRIDIGPGYRVYFTLREKRIVFLLNGGNKSSQQSDIKQAIEIAREI